MPLLSKSRAWPPLRALSGWQAGDIAAGLTLAAIAVPEQMATARLGGFPPAQGFLVFIAGTVMFAIFGSSRVASSGADTTVTSIFAGALALLAMSGSPAYFALAALLALMTGAALVAAGFFRMGWIANLLSIPVTTGFLAGIAVHIVLSQLPALFAQASVWPLGLSIGVFALTFLLEKWDCRIPAALIAMILAAAATAVFDLERHGVALIGTVLAVSPHVRIAVPHLDDIVRLLPLAFIIAIVTMVQTAATARAFPVGPPDINGDFVGVGMGSVLSGLTGGFPVNTSPPRTGAVFETGGRSQFAGLLAAMAVGLLLAFGTGLLARIPTAALAGVLFFVAQRILRVSVFIKVWRESRGEFLLILATMAAIVVLPIQVGVGIGIVLSLLHGLWTITRARPIEFERVPGTTVWWPADPHTRGETLPGILVFAFQAPLAFLNADNFERGAIEAIDGRAKLKLVVLEASSVAEIDFTAAQALAAILEHCRDRGIDFAVARLESTRARDALARFGILKQLRDDHLFHSVEEAIAGRPGGGCAATLRTNTYGETTQRQNAGPRIE